MFLCICYPDLYSATLVLKAYVTCRICEWGSSDVAVESHAYQPSVDLGAIQETVFARSRQTQLLAISHAVNAGLLGPVQNVLSFHHVQDQEAQQVLQFLNYEDGVAAFKSKAGQSLLHHVNDLVQYRSNLAATVDRMDSLLTGSQPGVHHYIVKPYNSRMDQGLADSAALFSGTKLELLQLFCAAPAGHGGSSIRRTDSRDVIDLSTDSDGNSSDASVSVPATLLPYIVMVITLRQKGKRKCRESDASQQDSAKKGRQQDPELTSQGSASNAHLHSAGPSLSSPAPLSVKVTRAATSAAALIKSASVSSCRYDAM